MRSPYLQAIMGFMPTTVAARVVSENDTNDRQNLMLTGGVSIR